MIGTESQTRKRSGDQGLSFLQPWVFYANNTLSLRVLSGSHPWEGRGEHCSESLGKAARSHWACEMSAAYGAQQMV